MLSGANARANVRLPEKVHIPQTRKEIIMNRIPVSLVVLTGNFRTPKNKNLDHPRVLSQRVLSSCVSSGLAYPLSDEIGEKTHSRLSFGENKPADLWGKK